MLLVTGASGFVGAGLTAELDRLGLPYRCALRNGAGQAAAVTIGDIGPDTDWAAALDGVDTVIHLAGRAHILASESDALAQFRKVNAAGTGRLAEQAAAAGIRRFVLVSSVKAAADTSGRAPLRETDPPAPGTPYGVSKLEGERALLEAAGAMETVILRPPLVYGRDVRANFHALLRIVEPALPLPLASVRNARSLIARENLVSAILTAMESPGAAGGVFYVSDGPALSTPELIRALARALGRPARLLPFPPFLLDLAATALGRAAAADSLLRSLAVDDGAFRAATGWQPPISQEAAFADLAGWYRRKGAQAVNSSTP
jgi:nucleoside-diphosphate-sugar epimerase